MSAPSDTGAEVRGLGRRAAMPLILAGVVLMGFFGGFGYWAATAPLAGAAVATGTVSTENSRRTVEHLEGGVIERILVRDGQVVAAGEPLVILDDTRARAQVDTQDIAILTLEAQLFRLRAERAAYAARDAGGSLVFPEGFGARVAEPEKAEDILDLERTRYDSRMAALAARVEVLEQSKVAYGVEIAGLQDEIVSIEAQLALLREDGVTLEDLAGRGLEVRRTLSENLLRTAQVEQQLAERRSRIAGQREAIQTADLQYRELWATALDEATAEIAQVTQELLNARATYDAYLDQLERTVMRAPVSGTLIELSVNTEGAVIAPGETVVEIVPSDEELRLEARISPNDIDVVTPGQVASVVLLSYPQRNLPKLHGTLESVSADSLVDSATGETYYLGIVMIEDEEIARLGEGIALVPGMPVQVMVQVSSRTFLDYVMSPLLRSADLAFREP